MMSAALVRLRHDTDEVGRQLAPDGWSRGSDSRSNRWAWGKRLLDLARLLRHSRLLTPTRSCLHRLLGIDRSLGIARPLRLERHLHLGQAAG
jgi:hypothetical protein